MKASGLRPVLILALLISMHIAVNHFIISQSFLLRRNGDVLHINEALQYSRTITDQKSGGFFKAASDAIRTEQHPHLYAFFLGAVLSLDPPTDHKGLDLPIQNLNSVFLLILIYSAYGIGNLLFGRQAGLLTAILLSLCPVIFGPTRLALIEVPLAALVSLTVFLLLKSDHFSLRRVSLLAGVSFGLAQLTKEAAFIFIVPAALFLFFPLDPGAARKQKALNLLAFFAAAILISMPVYLNPENKIMYSRLWRILNIPSPANTRTNSPLLYLEALPRFYFGWIAFFATLPLLVSYAINIRKRNILLAIWIAIPLVVCVFSCHKAVRYLIPAMPALFLTISGEIFTPVFRRISTIYAALLTLVFAAQFCLFNFGPLKPGYRAYDDQTSGLLTIYRDKELPEAERLVDFISSDTKPKKQLRIVALPISTIFYDTFQYLFRLRGMDIEYIALRKNKIPALEKWRTTCASAQYLFDFAANPEKSKRLAKLLAPDYQKYAAECRPLFDLAGEFHMQDDNIIYVYRRK